jgi:uncharacterized glyoxalase superfamily protein PhnB
MHNRSMPPGAVIPELPYPDIGEAVAWLCGAFGFTERLRIADHRSQILVGAGSVVAVEARPSFGPSSIMVRVADVDAHYRRAVGYGARVSGPPTSYPYGERQYNAQDLAGHYWTFSQSVADVDPADWGGTLMGGDAQTCII